MSKEQAETHIVGTYRSYEDFRFRFYGKNKTEEEPTAFRASFGKSLAKMMLEEKEHKQ